MPARQLAIEECVAALVCRLVFDGMQVPLPKFGRVVAGRWGGGSLDGLDAECVVEDATLKFKTERRRNHFPPGSFNIRNQPGEITFDDGSTLAAPFVHRVERGRHDVLDFSYWRWATGRRGVAWVGVLKHGYVENGNLTAVEGDYDRFNRCGLRLQGCYRWTLLQPERRGTVVAVVEMNGELERAKLWADFTALEFALGTPLELDVVVDVDEGGRAVGAYAPEFGSRCIRGSTNEPPVATGRWSEDRLQWSAPLFRRLADALHRDDAKFLVGAAGYVDAIADHFEANYVKAQIALEAVCRNIVEDRASSPLVKNTRDWASWVQANEAMIRSLAQDDESARRLLNKVRNAFQGSPTDVVPAVLATLGVAGAEEAVAETRGRNVAAHRYKMPGEPGADPDGVLRRLRMVRTLLAAVVAHAAGYAGPMLGWDVDGQGHRVPVSLWEEDAAQRTEADASFEARR